MSFLKNVLGIGIFLFVLSLLFGCQTPAGRSPGNVIDDATISTKVKALLFDDEMVKGFAISVETFEGHVTLTGGVDSEQQKIRAGEIARSVNGVRVVNNLITVRNS